MEVQSIVQRALQLGLGTKQQDNVLLVQKTADNASQQLPFQQMRNWLVDKDIAFSIKDHKEITNGKLWNETLLHVPLPLRQRDFAMTLLDWKVVEDGKIVNDHTTAEYVCPSAHL